MLNPIIAGVLISGVLAYIPSTTVYVAPPEVFTTVQATVTAYTSSPNETDDTPFLTASGKHTQDGIVACPKELGFGTEVEIHGRRYVCEDRMNARYRNSQHFDVWVESKEIAYKWGRQSIEVKIYK